MKVRHKQYLKLVLAMLLVVFQVLGTANPIIGFAEKGEKEHFNDTFKNIDSVNERGQNFIFQTEESVQLKQTLNLSNDIVPGKIVVKYKEGAANENDAASIISAKSAKAVKLKSNLNVQEIELSSGTDIYTVINELKKDPNVEYAEPVYVRRLIEPTDSGGDYKKANTVAQSVYNDLNPAYNAGDTWVLDKINIQSAWDKVSIQERGAVTIAILDTGIDSNHEDLKNNIVDGYDFIENDPTPNDEHGHGTHVAGIAAAIIDNGKGIAGVAGGAKIMPVRVLDETGVGDTLEIVNGIYWAVDHGADVINMSLGSAAPSQLEYEAIQYAIEKGVIVIAATGNDSDHPNYSSPVNYPAAYPNVIGVGAIGWQKDTGFYIGSFSNIGEEVDIVAPGINILSTLPQDTYARLDGTSMATPFVSGLAALIIAGNNDLTVEQVSDILMQSAVDIEEPYGSEGWDEYYGFGRIDGERAFSLPRLDIELETSSNGDQVTVNLVTEDYNGTVNDEVYGEAKLIVDIYDEQDGWIPDDMLNNTVVSIVYGEGSKVLNLKDVGVYSIFADDNNDEGWVWSPYAYVIKKPAQPVANVAAGTYTIAQTVTLSTQTAGAKIYYTLDGSAPTTSSALYTNAITISSSKTLKAIAVKNGIVSNVSTYAYTISASTGGSTGGGGGGGGALPQKNEDKIDIIKDENGKTTVTVESSEDKLLKELDAASDKPVVVDAKTKENADKLEVKLSAKVIKKALEKGKTIQIQANNLVFEIQPGTLDIKDEDASVTLTALDDGEVKLSSNSYTVSNVFDFDLYVNNKVVKNFNKPIRINAKYDAAKVKDTRKLGVYHENQQTNQWDFVGGKVNADSTITFEAPGFSKYMIAEYSKTFEDIQNHWAKDAVEVMAARHITKGVSDKAFAPDKNITRAEFAVWLAKALNINTTNQKSVFSDVDDFAWYKDAIMKVYGANIVKGTSEASFDPQAYITREQMATMIMNAYAYKKGLKLEEMVITAEVKFKDEGSTSQWARRNVRLVEASGLMKGTPEGNFVPKDNATRAQAMVVIKNLMEKLDLM